MAQRTITPAAYAKNVIRSAGYIGVETLKGINPTLTSYITDTGGMAKETYSTAKQFLKNPKSLLRDYIGEENAENVANLGRNILDDIRTGNFYNPERQKADTERYFKNELGFSFDDLMDDADFDVDEDYGEDSKSSSGSSSKAIDNLSKTQQKLTVASTDSITNTLNRNTDRSIEGNAKMMGMVNNSITMINSSILNLHKDLVTPLNSHITNSAAFYKSATEELSKQTKYLENISSMLNQRFNPKRKSNDKLSAWEDITADGLPNLKKIAQYAKGNFKKTNLGGMLDFLNSDMLSLAFSGGLSSPLAIVASMALSSMIGGSRVGKSLDRTTSILKSGGINLLSRIHSYNKNNRINTWDAKKGAMVSKHKNPILGFFAQLFDFMPDDKGKKDLKTSIRNYDKGPTSWTGRDAKALRDVIPNQLATIISILSGTEPTIFNYETGRWEKVSKSIRDFSKSRIDNAGSTNSEYKDQLANSFVSNSNGRFTNSSRATYDLKKDFDSLMFLLSNSGFSIESINSNPNIKRDIKKFAKTHNWNKLMTNPRSLDRLMDMMFSNRNLGQTQSAIINSRYADTRLVNNAGQTTFGSVVASTDLYNQAGRKVNNKGELFGNGGKANIFGEDKYGHDIFYYLQQYYKQLDYLAKHSGASSGGKNANKFRGYDESLLTLKKQEDIDKRKNQKKKSGWNNERDIKKSDGTWAKVGSKEHSKIMKNVSDSEVAAGPGNFISNGISGIIDGINDSMEYILYGANPTRDDRNYGILGTIKKLPEKFSEVFEKASESIKDIFGKLWEKFTGTNFAQRYKSKLKDTISSPLKDASNFAKSTWYNSKSKAADFLADVVRVNEGGTAAYGGRVRKSGMVSVSEGELIIPAEQNPYYNKSVNKSAQRASERRNLNKWIGSGGNPINYWGSYADGGTVSETESLIHRLSKRGYSTDQIKDELKKLGKDVTPDFIKKIIKLRQVKNDAKSAAARYKNSMSESGKKIAEGLSDNPVANILKQSITTLFGEYIDGAKVAFGNMSNKAGDTSKEVLSVLKKQFPETMATGSIGAIIGGSLTGSGLGLLGGFVLGAGVNILKNSETLSGKLFGTYDSNGETKTEGLIPSSIVKIVKKTAPDLAKSAALGGILGGLIPGVPGGMMTGILAGAAIQVLYNTNTIHNTLENALFGAEDVNGKRKGGILGSIKVRVVDPIADYVTNGLDRLDKYFKDEILAPLKKMADPLRTWINGVGTKLLNGIGKSAVKAFDSLIKEPGEFFDASIGRMLGLGGKASEALISTAGKVIKTPFSLIGKGADKLEKHNIKAGYSKETASQRVSIMGGKTSGYNKHLASLEGDEEKYNQYVRDVDFYSSGKKAAEAKLERHKRETSRTVKASLVNAGMGDPKTIKVINSLFKDADKTGNYNVLKKYIETLPEAKMSASTKEKVLERLNDEESYIQNQKNKFANYEQERREFFNTHKELGVNIKEGMSEKKIQKALKPFSMQAYIDNRGLEDSSNRKFDESVTTKAKAEERLKEQDKENPQGAKTNSLAEEILGVTKEIRDDNRSANDMPEPGNISGPANNTINNKVKSEERKKKAYERASTEDFNPKEGDSRINPLTGNREEYHNNSWVPDMSDAETKNSVIEEKEDRELKNKFFSYITTGGLTSSLSDLLLGKDGEKEEESLWDKLKNFGSGISNFFSNIGGNLAKIPSILGGMTSKLTTVAGALVGGGTILSFLESWKNHIDEGLGSVITHGFDAANEAEAKAKGYKRTNYNEGEYQEEYTIEHAAKTMAKQATLGRKTPSKLMNVVGKGIRGGLSLGNKLIQKGASKLTTSKFGTTMGSFADKHLGKTVTNALVDVSENGVLGAAKNGLKAVGTAGKNILTKSATVLGNTAAGTTIKNAFKGAKDITSGVISKSETATKVTGAFKNAVTWVVNKATALLSKFTGKTVGSAAEVAANLSDDVVEAATKTAGKSAVSSAMKKFNLALMVIDIGLAIENGWEDAQANIGILETPTIGERFLSALAEGLSELAFGLVKPTTLIDAIIWVADYLGFDTELIQERRAAGKAALEAHNNDPINVDKQYNTVKDYLKNEKKLETTQDKIKNFASNAIKKSKNILSSVFGKLKNAFSGSTSNSPNAEFSTMNTTATTTGGSSGAHTIQNGYKRFANSTLGKMGCGPASAATVIKSYGGNTTLEDAADYATNNGYVAGSSGTKGTKASYFRDILGANGISTRYTSNSKDIQSAVGSGNPTVLLGQDRSNTNKANSPFGPNPHYVVANGTDSRGNVYIDDPELNRTALYNKNILKNAKLGIATGGDSGINITPNANLNTLNSAVNAKGNEFISGTGKTTDSASKITGTSSTSNLPKASNNIEAIWGYYKKLGLSDDAVAGILGNIDVESASTFNPKAVEGVFINHLKGSGSPWNTKNNIYADLGVDVSSKEKAYETYTAAIDSGKISNDEFQHPYKMLNDPKFKSNKAKTGHEWLQYGYGLTQFTSPHLKDQLYQATVAQGKSISDLGAQLDVITSQLNDAGVLSAFKNSNITYAKAAEEMLTKYEKPADANKQIKSRGERAKKFLDAYKGKNFDVDNYVSSSTSFGNVASSTNELGQTNTAEASASTTGTDLSSILSSFFGNVFGKVVNSFTGKDKSLLGMIFGTNGNDSTTTTDSTTGTTSNIQTSVAGDNTPSYGGKAKAVPSDAYGKGTPEAMVKIAQSQLGVVEGGNNNEGNITDYGKFLKMDGQPWCASFVSWVMDQAFGGDTTKRNKALRGGTSASVSTFWDNFKRAGAMSSTPQPGDVIIFKNNGASHTGLVETVNGNSITTIEGNTGAENTYERNGGVVARHQFTIGDGSKLDKKLTGFGRPDWTGSGSGLPIYDFTGGASNTTSGISGSDKAALLGIGAQIKKSGTTSTSTPIASAAVNTGNLDMTNAIKLLAQIASNTGYNKDIATIVDVLKSMVTMMSSTSSSTTSSAASEASSVISAAKQDSQNNIDQDLSSLMSKLDSIATYM